jgi:hypothetical protein
MKILLEPGEKKPEFCSQCNRHYTNEANLLECYFDYKDCPIVEQENKCKHSTDCALGYNCKKKAKQCDQFEQ